MNRESVPTLKNEICHQLYPTFWNGLVGQRYVYEDHHGAYFEYWGWFDWGNG